MQREIVTIIEQSGDSFVASSPEFPSAVGRGSTAQESWKNLVDSVNLETRPEPQRTGRKPFVVTPIHLELPAEWTSGKVEDLFDILDGVDRKW